MTWRSWSRNLSGVDGKSRARTPVALQTASATAAAPRDAEFAYALGF
jgi:hypothetical protein